MEYNRYNSGSFHCLCGILSELDFQVTYGIKRLCESYEWWLSRELEYWTDSFKNADSFRNKTSGYLYELVTESFPQTILFKNTDSFWNTITCFAQNHTGALF